MTLPKISIEVMAATTHQAVRQSREEFALATMHDAAQEQPELHETIQTLVVNMLAGSQDVEGGMVPVEFTQAMIIEAAYLTLGLTLKGFNAQVEADELNEAWG